MKTKLKKAAEKLNAALSKKRKIIIINKWDQLWSDLSCGSLPDLKPPSWEELESEIWHELKSEFFSEIEKEIGQTAYIQLEREFFSQLCCEKELWSELKKELDYALEPEDPDDIGSETWKYYDNDWVLFALQRYPHLSVFQKNKEKVEAIRDIVEAGNAYIWLSSERMYLLPMPEEIHRNDQKKLHNEQGYALSWAGQKTYWLNGVKLEKTIWEKMRRKN
ncbi:MAG: hypothetical protein KatS3mg101_1029 [Patescibacteria group bacterium]|nr:MAG: hypothetical protein KatS3mg101_1029 [Patescibacteria group bacterium]